MAWLGSAGANAGSISFDLVCSHFRVARWLFDVVSGYKHKPIPPGSTMSLEELRKKGYVMTEQEWINVSSVLL